MEDPANEQAPDFDLAEYGPRRSAAGENPDDPDSRARAVGILTQLWAIDHQVRLDAWTARQQQQQQQQQQDAQLQTPAPVGNVPFPPIDRQAAAPRHFAARVSEYARARLQAREYVELWYFSKQAVDIARGELSDARDTYGITQSSGKFEIRATNDSRASKAAIPDAHLTFNEVNNAAACILREMAAAGWPDEQVLAWSEFYERLAKHPAYMTKGGEEALVLYHARVRRQWFEDLHHAHLRLKAGDAAQQHALWDIGAPMDDDILRECRDEYYNNLFHQKAARLDDMAARAPSVQTGGPHRRQRSPAAAFSRAAPYDIAKRDNRRGGARPDEDRGASRDHRQLKRGRTDDGSGRDEKPSTTAFRRLAEICAICLSRQPHDLARCEANALWDGKPARCTRSGKARITNPRGQDLCTDWQRPRGCSSTSVRHVHECSGCGSSAHGAHGCPLVEAI